VVAVIALPMTGNLPESPRVGSGSARVQCVAMPTTDDARLSTDPFGHRTEFEGMIGEISSKFINLPAGEVDGEIEDALGRICEPLGVELAVLWQWSPVAPGIFMPTHAYCAEAGLRPSTPMTQEQYPWATQQVLSGRMIAFSSPEALPTEAAVDRETCRLYGIKSALCFPLSLKGEPAVGALGFNALRTARDCPAALVKRLQLVAQVIANALD